MADTTPPEWTVEPMDGGGFLIRGYGGMRVVVTGPNAQADAIAIGALPHLINAARIALAWYWEDGRPGKQQQGEALAVSSLKWALGCAGATLPKAGHGT